MHNHNHGAALHVDRQLSVIKNKAAHQYTSQPDYYVLIVSCERIQIAVILESVTFHVENTLFTLLRINYEYLTSVLTLACYSLVVFFLFTLLTLRLVDYFFLFLFSLLLYDSSILFGVVVVAFCSIHLTSLLRSIFFFLSMRCVKLFQHFFYWLWFWNSVWSACCDTFLNRLIFCIYIEINSYSVQSYTEHTLVITSDNPCATHILVLVVC